MNKIDKLITNNSGYSSTNFTVIIAAAIIPLLSIIWVFVLLTIDLLNPHLTLSINLAQMSIFVGSIEAIIGVILGVKIYNDRRNKETEYHKEKGYYNDVEV